MGKGVQSDIGPAEGLLVSSIEYGKDYGTKLDRDKSPIQNDHEPM